jgi:hypothetical protein
LLASWNLLIVLFPSQVELAAGHAVWMHLAAGEILAHAGALLCFRGYRKPSQRRGGEPAQAGAFLYGMEGHKEMMETEPGLYRHTEVNGDGCNVHIAKMAE